jgi:hypothetical protein
MLEETIHGYDGVMAGRGTIRDRARWSAALALAIVGVVLCAQATAQNALDASLHLGSGGINSAVGNNSVRPYIRRVTDDSREFQIRTGYISEGEFFRNYARDSMVNDITRNPNRAERYDRYPTETTFIDRDSWKKKDPLRYDSQGLALSTSTYRVAQDDGTAMASFRTKSGETGVLTASTLRGVKLERDRDRLGLQGVNMYETARLREDIRNNTIKSDAIGVGLGDPFKAQQPKDAVAAMKAPPDKTRGDLQGGEPIDLSIKGYDAVVKGVKEKFEERFRQEERALRDLKGEQAKPKGDGAGDESGAGDRVSSAYERLKREISEKKLADDLKQSIAKSAVKPGASAADGAAKKAAQPTGMTAEEYALVLKHGQRIDTMTGEEKNRLNELLAEGQRAMYEGNSFVAEKRFEVALAIHPNDPLALAGLLHCEIGANLSASASITLHKLFTQHPEMMDVQWGPQTLPPRERIEKSLADVRHRVAMGKDASQYGLLMAYLGHLLGDQDAITAGLYAVRGSPGDEKMAQILRKLWVDPSKDPTPGRVDAPAAPQENPPASAPATPPTAPQDTPQAPPASAPPQSTP